MLNGVRVLDRSTNIAGPYCAKLLADAGADVVKVEPPAGDPLRRWSASGTPIAPDDAGRRGQCMNTSKRSVVLDLEHPGDIERVRSLAASAALVVEDLGPGVVESHGLGWPDLQR